MNSGQFIYCHKDDRGDRWFYCESEGFRERREGSSSYFSRNKSAAYRFGFKDEAWAHCRERRKGGNFRGGKWVVIKLRTRAAQEEEQEGREE